MISIVFYHTEKEHEVMLADAFEEGCTGREVSFSKKFTAEYIRPEADIAVIMGVKGATKKIMDDYLKSGRQCLYLDKGYVRRKVEGCGISEYYRLSVNSTQPTNYFQTIPQSSKRWDKLGYNLQRMYKNPEGAIIFAGSSQKYCDFHGLGDATEYAQSVIKEIRKCSNNEIIYRPKPSWSDATPIEDTTYSGPERKIWVELENAYCLITHGSNAAFDALINGVPVIILGDGVARPLSRTKISDINNLYYPNGIERLQWFYDLAFCQWRIDEICSGRFWKHIGSFLNIKI
jgi:hypothetical protein